MIESDFAAQWFPALRAVTLLARNLELVAVWTTKWSVENDLLTECNTPRQENKANEKKGPWIWQTNFHA